MKAAGQNLKRLLKKQGWGRRPLLTEAMDAIFDRTVRYMIVVY